MIVKATLKTPRPPTKSLTDKELKSDFVKIFEDIELYEEYLSNLYAKEIELINDTKLINPAYLYFVESILDFNKNLIVELEEELKRRNL